MTTLNNTDISILNKGKTPASTNNVETYNKKILGDKIRKLITTNVQLMIDKIEIKKIRINLKTDKIRLLDKKNSLIVKKEKLRTEIVILNVARSSNVPIRNHQNPLLKPTQNKFKIKRPLLFDNIKKTFKSSL